MSKWDKLYVDFALFNATNLMLYSNFLFDHSIFWPLFKVELQVSGFNVWVVVFGIFDATVDGTSKSNSLSSFSPDSSRIWGIYSVIIYLFVSLLWDALCCIDPCLMFDAWHVGSCFVLNVRFNLCRGLFYVVWDPFVAMLVRYSWSHVCLIEIPLLPCSAGYS